MNNHAKHQSKRNEPLERQVDSYQTQPRIGEQEGFWDMVENDRPTRPPRRRFNSFW